MEVKETGVGEDGRSFSLNAGLTSVKERVKEVDWGGRVSDLGTVLRFQPGQ